MGAITDYMSSDHKYCDDVFASLERSISDRHWDTAAQEMTEFINSMTLHFGMEEEVLFPAFEQATGNTTGPTSVMRAEHQQMCGIMKQMQEALDERDAVEFLGASETLSIMLQQHNMKEEGILYPMTDRVLSDKSDAILAVMNNMSIPV